MEVPVWQLEAVLQSGEEGKRELRGVLDQHVPEQVPVVVQDWVRREAVEQCDHLQSFALSRGVHLILYGTVFSYLYELALWILNVFFSLTFSYDLNYCVCNNRNFT